MAVALSCESMERPFRSETILHDHCNHTSCHPFPRALANLGLGTGQIIAAFAERPEFLLLGAFIDGCTSYSFPLAQAYIADVTPPEKLPEAYGAFQVRKSACMDTTGLGAAQRGRGMHSVPLWVLFRDWCRGYPCGCCGSVVTMVQGLAAGAAFLVGIPVGGILASK